MKRALFPKFMNNINLNKLLKQQTKLEALQINSTAKLNEPVPIVGKLDMVAYRIWNANIFTSKLVSPLTISLFVWV